MGQDVDDPVHPKTARGTIEGAALSRRVARMLSEPTSRWSTRTSASNQVQPRRRPRRPGHEESRRSCSRPSRTTTSNQLGCSTSRSTCHQPRPEAVYTALKEAVREDLNLAQSRAQGIGANLVVDRRPATLPPRAPGARDVQAPHPYHLLSPSRSLAVGGDMIVIDGVDASTRRPTRIVPRRPARRFKLRLAGRARRRLRPDVERGAGHRRSAGGGRSPTRRSCSAAGSETASHCSASLDTRGEELKKMPGVRPGSVRRALDHLDLRPVRGRALLPALLPIVDDEDSGEEAEAGRVRTCPSRRTTAHLPLEPAIYDTAAAPACGSSTSCCRPPDGSRRHGNTAAVLRPASTSSAPASGPCRRMSIQAARRISTSGSRGPRRLRCYWPSVGAVPVPGRACVHLLPSRARAGGDGRHVKVVIDCSDRRAAIVTSHNGATWLDRRLRAPAGGVGGDHFSAMKAATRRYQEPIAERPCTAFSRPAERTLNRRRSSADVGPHGAFTKVTTASSSPTHL